MRVLILVLCCIVPVAAFAQQAQPQRPNPCVRGPTQMSIGGVDQDEAKCREAMLEGLYRQTSSDFTSYKLETTGMAAKLALANSDAALARAQLDDVHSKLTWYQQYVDGANEGLLQLPDLKAKLEWYQNYVQAAQPLLEQKLTPAEPAPATSPPSPR